MTARPRGRYVYAVVGARGRTPRARGIGGGALARVAAGRVGALVEPMEHRPAATIARLAAQERLLRRLSAMLPAILPARFGSFVADESEVRRFLRTRERALAAALRRVRGAEQMILRLFLSAGVTASATAPAVRRSSKRRRKTGASTSGAAYLAHRAAELSGANVPALAAIREALASRRLLRDQRVETHRGSVLERPTERTASGAVEGRAVSVYHLIPRGRSRAYCSTVFEVVSRQSAVAAVVTGPWPPYAFAPEPLE